MAFIANAFSLQMLSGDADISVRRIAVEDIPKDVESAIGHTDTAAVVSSMLGVELQPNRVNVSLEAGDVLYVAQLRGGRLPEGSTTLPEGFSIDFVKVTVVG